MFGMMSPSSTLSVWVGRVQLLFAHVSPCACSSRTRDAFDAADGAGKPKLREVPWLRKRSAHEAVQEVQTGHVPCSVMSDE